MYSIAPNKMQYLSIFVYTPYRHIVQANRIVKSHVEMILPLAINLFIGNNHEGLGE